MSKRVKKRFNSEVNVIDFQTYLPSKKHRVSLYARNDNQQQYLEKLQDDDTNIIFAVGPAGTGKTMLAVQVGIKLLQEGKFDKIIVTRPAVSVDEDLGFLPGTMQEKMAPWTRPIFDVLGEYYLKKDIENMINEGVIEISPLAYMVVTGDLNQADRLNDNGLIDFIRQVNEHKSLKCIDIQHFDKKDIERHDAVKEVLSVYGE